MHLSRAQPGPDGAGLRVHLIVAVFAWTLIAATPAFADATLFLGSTMTPANRPTKGVALGATFLVVGFEFEFAGTGESVEDAAPALRTGMGNLLLQTPFPTAGMQFYFATGGGMYRERLNTRQETQIALDAGGGVKITLLGPMRVRLDYRVFKLRGEPLHPTVQRVYAGLAFAI